MSAPAVLLFGLSGEPGRLWRAAALRLRIRIREVSPAECDTALADILQNAAPEAAAAPLAPLPEPMLVMAGFAPALMDAYLKTARTMGAQRVALKAVLTPYNASWSAVRLHGELAREHEAMLRHKNGK